MLPTAENHDYVESLKDKWDSIERLLLNVISIIEKWIFDNHSSPSAHKYLENLNNNVSKPLNNHNYVIAYNNLMIFAKGFNTSLPILVWYYLADVGHELFLLK
jgi:hypothetical protein